MKKLAILLVSVVFLFATFHSAYANDAEAEWDVYSGQLISHELSLQAIDVTDGLIVNKDVDDLNNKNTKTVAGPAQVGKFDHENFQKDLYSGDGVVINDYIESKGMNAETDMEQTQQITTHTAVQSTTDNDCNGVEVAKAGAEAHLTQNYSHEQVGIANGYYGAQAGTSSSSTESSVVSSVE